MKRTRNNFKFMISEIIRKAKYAWGIVKVICLLKKLFKQRYGNINIEQRYIKNILFTTKFTS
jgi:hypothetical protein